MTRTEVLNTQGFHAATVHALVAHLRANVPRGTQRAVDPTALVNNEGRLQGFFDAIEMLGAVLQPDKPKSQEKILPYSQPPTHPQQSA